MAETKWLTEREQLAWRALQMMKLRLDACLTRDLAEQAELSLQDYSVLVELTDRAEGRMRLYELGEELSWEKSRLSHHITRMAARGLVAKERCNQDRRGAFVSITPHGRAAIEGAAPGHVASVRRYVVDALTSEQLDELAAIAASIRAACDADDAHPAPVRA